MAHDRAMQLLVVGDGASADGIVLEVIPHPLVRIQLRGIRGKKEEPQAPFDRWGFQKRGHLARFM